MSDLTSLSALFENKIFRIPDYQRGYAWDTNQLDDFWDDLYNLTKDRYHYTGMLSLKLLSENETRSWDEGERWLISCDYKPYHVVDGQQRLTTSIILLTSILNIASENKIDYFNGVCLDEIKEKYIVKSRKPLNLLKAYKFGYECDNPSFKYLRYRILGESYSGSVDESFYTLNLQNAKDYFDNKISQLYDEKGQEGLENIYLKLVNRLQFNTHYIDDDFDVFVAFETMNNRGKKLSNLEILKNRLIYLSTIYSDSILPQAEKVTLRSSINDTWREVYKQLGRNKYKSLDDDEYLRNHWTLFYKYTRNKGDDYIQFLLNRQFTPKAIYGEQIQLMYKEFENDEEAQIELYDNQDVLVPKEIIDYVNSLKEVAEYWYLSYNPDEADCFTVEEQKWINRLNHIGINYFRTLVVAAMMNKKVSTDERINLFKAIERFIFLCFRLAKYNSNYNSVNSYKYARQLYFEEININEITDFFNSEFERNVDGALKSFKADIERSFTNDDGYYSWYPLKYFLFEYEAKLSEGRNIAKLSDWKAFVKPDNDKISIEHIFPQKPTAYYWRNNFRKYQDDGEQHKLANSLGNLLALSQSVNSSLQNDEFELKKKPSNGRKGYSDGSYSEMEVAKYENWTPYTIYERGMNLLKFMEERWNFKFPDENFKIDVLGLRFLFDNREDIPEIVDIDYTSRDSYFSGDKGEIKVSDYLNGKDLYLIKYYSSFFDELKKVIPTLYEVATKNYIALRCEDFSRNIAEIHLQNSKHKICIVTRQPSNLEEASGEVLPDGYLWSLNYRVYLSEGSDFKNVLAELNDVYTNLLISIANDSEEKDNKVLIERSNKIFDIIKKYEADGLIVSLTRSKIYIRFTSTKIRDRVGLVGDGTWSGIKDLIVWEFENRIDSCKISLYIGPAETEIRNTWYDFTKNNDVFLQGKQKNKWTPIYREYLYNEGDSIDSFLKRVDSFFKDGFIKVDKNF